MDENGKSKVGFVMCFGRKRTTGPKRLSESQHCCGPCRQRTCRCNCYCSRYRRRHREHKEGPEEAKSSHHEQVSSEKRRGSKSGRRDTSKGAVTETKHVQVLIDGQEVGWSYGKDKKFRLKGVEIALKYFSGVEKKAKVILPETVLRDEKDLATKKRLLDSGCVWETASSNSNLHELMLKQAIQHRTLIVSNMYSKFQDVLSEMGVVPKGSDDWKRIKRRLIPYIFVRDEFIPHPHPSHLANPRIYTPRYSHDKRLRQYAFDSPMPVPA